MNVAPPICFDAADELERKALAGQMFDFLTDRERTIIKARFGFGEPELTLADIGASLGVTPARIRQIEQGALNKIRSGLRQPARLKVRHAAA